MAQFCAVYPWCSPDVFWDLTLSEWSALRPYVQAQVKEWQHG